MKSFGREQLRSMMRLGWSILKRVEAYSSLNSLQMTEGSDHILILECN